MLHPLHLTCPRCDHRSRGKNRDKVTASPSQRIRREQKEKREEVIKKRKKKREEKKEEEKVEDKKVSCGVIQEEREAESTAKQTA